MFFFITRRISLAPCRTEALVLVSVSTSMSMAGCCTIDLTRRVSTLLDRKRGKQSGRSRCVNGGYTIPKWGVLFCLFLH